MKDGTFIPVFPRIEIQKVMFFNEFNKLANIIGVETLQVDFIPILKLYYYDKFNLVKNIGHQNNGIFKD
jgi:hypothetical protein